MHIKDEYFKLDSTIHGTCGEVFTQLKIFQSFYNIIPAVKYWTV